MTIFRDAGERDVTPILTLWNTVITETTITFTSKPKTVEDIARMIDTRRVRIACDPGFAGFATFGPFRDGPGYAHVAELTLMVAEDHRGTGLAKGMLNDLEAQAKADGIDILIAGISSSNTRADRFFARAGYELSGRLPKVGRKAGQSLNLIIRQKPLAS